MERIELLTIADRFHISNREVVVLPDFSVPGDRWVDLRVGGLHHNYSRQAACRSANNSPKIRQHGEKDRALIASRSSSAFVSSANRKARWESG